MTFKSFFTSVVSLTKKQRFWLFHLVCVPIRLAIGIITIAFTPNVVISILIMLWGIINMFTNVYLVSRSIGDMPVWWQGYNYYYREAFPIVLVIFSTLSIVFYETHPHFQVVCGVVLLLDPIKSTVQMTNTYM